MIKYSTNWTTNDNAPHGGYHRIAFTASLARNLGGFGSGTQVRIGGRHPPMSRVTLSRAHAR
jgi:hypothetical protein